MPSKILCLCLVLLAICIKHETLSQVVADFNCTIEFPICQKPGVAREEQDIVSFSILLDMEHVNLPLWVWQLVAVVIDDGRVIGKVMDRNWLTSMLTTECTSTTSLFIEHRYRIPYQRCRRDKRLLRMEIGVRPSTRFNSSNVIAVWMARDYKYKKSQSARYPMVLLKVEEKLRIDFKDMPGKNAYIRPGHYYDFQYCVTVRHTSWSMINFKIEGKLDIGYSRSNGDDDPWCPSYPFRITQADLHKTIRMSYWEIYGPCLMYINSTGLVLDVSEMYSSNSKANQAPKQPMELVLILVTLSGAAMWMSSTLDYLG